MDEDRCQLYDALNTVLEGMSAQNRDPFLQVKRIYGCVPFRGEF